MNAQQHQDPLDAALATEAGKRIEKLKDTTIDIAIRMKEAREFLAWSTDNMRGTWIEWLELSSKASGEINMLRMTFDRETRSVITAGKDIRDFFNSPEYIAAHARIESMVGLLERFTALKQNGTLDALAEFILKCQGTKL